MVTQVSWVTKFSIHDSSAVQGLESNNTDFHVIFQGFDFAIEVLNVKVHVF